MTILDVPAVESLGEFHAEPPPVEVPTSSPVVVGVATLLAVAAAGWMFAGVFQGVLPRFVGLLGALVGVGLVTQSHRTRRPSLLQYSVAPVAIALSLLFVIPSSHGATINLVTLVRDALRNGGVGHPPVPFDPGWRVILLVTVAVMGAAASTMALNLGRPKLGLVPPGALTFAATLVQPPTATTVSSVVALLLLIGAFTVSYGADLAKEGASSTRFEARRLIRGAGALVAVGIVLVLISQSGLLLPKQNSQAVIPPQFPQLPPPTPDRPLFSVDLAQPVPLRLGVLDVYRKVAWLTPPYDASRFETVPSGGAVSAARATGDSPLPLPPPDHAASQQITFTITDIGGHVLPDVANPLSLPHHGFKLQYDPRTQSLRLPNEVARRGLTYTEGAPAIPSAAELAAAPPPPSSLAEYLQVPPPPPAVAQLLAQAPTDNAFDRLQYVRNVYYRNVIAASSGQPVNVPPARVADLLSGRPGTPFEIVAGEVLLARWAGVPARMGYGYYTTTPVADGSRTYAVRPGDGAVWLEAYFSHFGWVPIVGTPPKAQASLDTNPKKQNPAVVPSDRLDLVTYVPIRLQSTELLFTVVRFWLKRVLPAVLVLILLGLFYPGLLKLLRTLRRRRWALDSGLPERIAVAYAELRDHAYDLNIGDVTMTPLEFTKAVGPDTEHRELAWLVTRALWGDLARDLHTEDADAAEDMSRSVLRRVRRANPALNRVIAFGSRTSLRDPYSEDIPNLWPRRRRVAAGLVGVAVLGLLVSGCATTTAANAAPPALPPRLLPSAVSDITFHEEPASEQAFTKAGAASLVSSGRVYSIHEGVDVQGSFQAAAFKAKYSARLKSVREGVLQSIAGRNFELTRVGAQRIYVAALPGEQILVWFPASGAFYELIDARQQFVQSENLFVALLNYQQGGSATLSPANTGVPQLDPRQGGDYS
jgi:transglutaminase-like putative cysteine protease